MALKLKRFLVLGCTGLVVAFLLATSGAQAATLNVVGGILYGASGVNVGGNLYDVQFIDGTCIALFSGCDSVSDFTFQSQAAAVLASQALLDQVFLDGANLFDSDPTRTVGCTYPPSCHAATPFGFYSPASVRWATAFNSVTEVSDSTAANQSASPTYNVTGNIDVVFAVWTPVPEPGTGLLVGLGLTWIGVARSRRNS